CAGIENYSRHLTGRRPGQQPYTLMDFLPEDTLVVVDESHVAVPQVGGMHGGDRSRKIPLVDYGFRLPSALDNRPLTFAEWEGKVQYLHSDVDTLERVEILRDLRLGTFDVLVGINLLREGLDLPEVAFIAILDADKESYLRDARSLIQTIGRAARNVEGHVILYGDTMTGSMQRPIDDTTSHRVIQVRYNE